MMIDLHSKNGPLSGNRWSYGIGPFGHQTISLDYAGSELHS